MTFISLLPLLLFTDSLTVFSNWCLHNNGTFWVKGTLILDAPVVSPGGLHLVSFTCS